MIILAVDLGNARTGLAVCDAGERLAFPKGTITEYRAERLVERIAQAAAEYGAQLIVAGLPRNMDGSFGSRADECSALAGEIERRSGLQTVLWDERCTTQAAYAALNEAGAYGKRRKKAVDTVAATVILESYLSYRRSHPEEIERPKGVLAASESDL